MRGPKMPGLLKSKSTIQRRLNNLGGALEEGTLNTGTKALISAKGKDISVKRKPKYLEVTEKRLKRMGVIDLKPHFAKSPYKQIKKGGGWYLRVPIRVKTRSMSRRLYDQLRTVDVSEGGTKTVVSDYLYDRRRQSDATMLNYTPKGKTIEKQNTGNRRHTYTAFRTVSDKSPASSWIVGRDKVNKDDTSKTFISNVNRLMRWKMRNGWR